MPSKLDIPFNVELLDLTPQKLQGLKPIRVLDSFDGASGNFHEDGLFSVSIFGRVGDEARMRRYSYIDIKVRVFHPIIFRTLVDLKQMYKGIIAGTDYAVFDEGLKDFVRSDAIHGKTGFAFFVANWEKIQFGDTKSVSREHNIKLIDKYKRHAMTDKVIVMPAGLRDMEIGADGRHEEGEVNTFYRALLGIANTIDDVTIRHSVETINTARYAMQSKFNQLYDMIEDMVAGRRKMVQNRWTARRIFNGTRNVITAMDTSTPVLGAPGQIGFNNTGIGLYQMMKAVLPVTRYLLRNGFLSKVFPSADQPARLVDKKTYKAKSVMLKPAYYDRYMTDEGIEKVITQFSSEDTRHRYLEIEGHYLGLIYKGPDNTFRFVQDIDEVPATRSTKDVYPITFCELLYLSTYQNLNKYPLFPTRYPVTGMGSIYPSLAFVKTTVKVEARRQLSESWEPMDDNHVAYQFPVRGSAFINSLIPHSSKLGRLGADFDGDTASGNALYTDEAVKEVNAFLSSRKAYLDVNGRFLSATDTDTVKLVLHNLTGD
jgi:hypothetical protein